MQYGIQTVIICVHHFLLITELSSVNRSMELPRCDVTESLTSLTTENQKLDAQRCTYIQNTTIFVKSRFYGTPRSREGIRYALSATTYQTSTNPIIKRRFRRNTVRSCASRSGAEEFVKEGHHILGFRPPILATHYRTLQVPRSVRL